MKGALTQDQKKEMHKKIADLMVEIEGGGNEEIRKYVFIKIDEEEPGNWSAGGNQATEEFVQRLVSMASAKV